MLVAALLQPHVIVGAHARSQCHLRAPKAGDPAAPEVLKADLVGANELASGT